MIIVLVIIIFILVSLLLAVVVATFLLIWIVGIRVVVAPSESKLIFSSSRVIGERTLHRSNHHLHGTVVVVVDSPDAG